MRKSYVQEGYCMVDNVYSVKELDEIESLFDDFKSKGHKAFGNPSGTDKSWGEFDIFGFDDIDPSKELLRAMHPHRFIPQVRQWFLHPRIGQILEALLGCSALGAQTMYYYKPPQSVGQGMHQDNFFLMSKPSTCIGTWTPIDDADEETGCLRVVRGSHKEEILCPPNEGQKNPIDNIVANSEIVSIPMLRGQTMFFSGQLIHGSEPNNSLTRNRRTFNCHYIDSLTEKLAKFYHPSLDMEGNVVDHITVDQSGGPCQ